MGKTFRRSKIDLETYQNIYRDSGNVDPVIKIKENERLYRKSRDKRLIEDYIDEQEKYLHEEYDEDCIENLEF